MSKNNTEGGYKEVLEKLLKETKYGTITLIVQDEKVVQINKEEKIRIL